MVKRDLMCASLVTNVTANHKLSGILKEDGYIVCYCLVSAFHNSFKTLHFRHCQFS